MKINDYEITLNNELEKLLKNYDDEKYGPNFERIFYALELTPLNKVKVCILGQDPYPKFGDACGLAFSVNRNEKLPASLRNIYKELQNDLGIVRTDGDLSDIAKQGVLLLNTVLTIEYGKANSHHNLGWIDTTNSLIEQVSNKGGVIFVLLGKQAQEYVSIIDSKKNFIIMTSHPSPLSAYRGFLGSKLFSQINELLADGDEIQW